MKFIAFILMSAVLVISTAQAETRYSLDDCFRLALARSDTLMENLESIRQAEEGIRQTRANFLPTANLSANLIRQEAPQAGVGQSLFPASQNTSQFTLSQSLFKGLQDLATLRQKKSLKAASSSAWTQAYLQLYQDTSQAYFAILEDEHDLNNYARELTTDQHRHQQLTGMQRFGRAREADVVSIKASIANVEASIAAAHGTLGADRATLAFLTGLDPDITLVDVDTTPALSTPLDDWLRKVDQRPDVQEARQNWEASDYAVASALGAHLPTASFTGDYYLTRPGAYSDVHWDAQLSLNLPIYAGGQTQSLVRKAISIRTSNEAAYNLARRSATEAIRSTYRTVRDEINQVSRLADASQLYDRYYALLLKDNQAGIATNVDVLLALATAEQTRRSFDRARLSSNYDYIRLRIAAADAEILEKATRGNSWPH